MSGLSRRALLLGAAALPVAAVARLLPAEAEEYVYHRGVQLDALEVEVGPSWGNLQSVGLRYVDELGEEIFLHIPHHHWCRCTVVREDDDAPLG